MLAYLPALFTIISVPRQKNSCHKDLCSRLTTICSAFMGKHPLWFSCSTFPVLRSTLQHPKTGPSVLHLMGVAVFSSGSDQAIGASRGGSFAFGCDCLRAITVDTSVAAGTSTAFCVSPSCFLCITRYLSLQPLS